MRRLLVAVVLLQLTYVILGNWYLNSFSLHHFVNRSPQHFFMDWTVARTWIPGVVRLEGVSLSGRGSKDLWFCSLRECAFTVSVPQLIRRRVECSNLRAAGVDFRLRQEDATDLTRVRPGHPSIPRLLAAPAPLPSSGGASPWFIEVEAVELSDVHQLWIAGLRVNGPGELYGSVRLVTRGEFEARVDAWRVPQAVVGISGVTVSTNASIQLSGKLGPLVFSEARGEQIYNHLDALLEVHGEVIDIGQLGGRVDPTSSLRLGGGGTLEASIQVVGGVYWPGSHLEIHSPQITITTGNYSWRGKATLIDRIETTSDQGPRARLEVEETQLELWYRDKRVEGAIGPRLSLQSVAHDLRLVGRFADADLRLEVSPMVVPDASLLNAHLPTPLSKVFQSGNVVATVQLNRMPDQGVVGNIELRGEDLAVFLASKEYRVDAQLNARFAAAASSKGHFDLSDTSLHLTNVSTPRLSARYLEPWSANVQLYQADLNFQEPWSLQGGVRVSMHDTRPILAALRSLPNAPSWLRWIPTIKDLGGQFDVVAAKDRISMHQLAFVGRGTDIKAELEMLDEKVLGLIYVRYGLIALGLELLKEDRDWHLLGAKRWYERRSQVVPN